MPRSRFVPLVSLALFAACADGVPTSPAVVGSTGAVTKRDNTGGDAAADVSVVMSGLDNPRQLAFGPEGALYVAEAGETSVTSNCFTAPRGLVCYSGTGAISRLWKGEQTRVASGLPSIFTAGPNDVTGPHDIAFQGRGNAYVTIGWGNNPTLRTSLGAVGSRFGTLNRMTPNGDLDVVTDIAAYELANNPAGGPIDSNPYGVLAEPGREFVTDAGGNSLLEVSATGAVSLVTAFSNVTVPPPFNTAEPVPTEVKRGPDGALYVSTLTGVPFAAGAASIYRVVPGSAPTVYAGGFTTITDFDFAPDGTMYVLQYSAGPVFFGGQGSVIRVAPNGTRTTIIGTLANPTGIVVGPEGAIYVTNHGNMPNIGEVLRIVP